MRRIIRCILTIIVSIALLTACSNTYSGSDKTDESESAKSSIESSSTTNFKWSEHQIKWVVPFLMKNKTTEQEQDIQRYLSQKGIDASIHFEVVSGFDKEYGDAVKNIQDADIINTGAWFYQEGVADFVLSGIFEKLDDRFKSEPFKSVYEAIPEYYWQTTEINGEHYTIPSVSSDIEYNEFYIAVRSDLLKEFEGIDANDTDRNLLPQILNYMDNTDKGNLGIVEAPEMIYQYLDYYMINGLLYDRQKQAFVSYTELSKLNDISSRLQDLRNRIYALDETADASANCIAYYYLDGFEPDHLSDEEYTVFTYRQYMMQTSLLGVSNGIAAASDKKELAMDIINLMYTDREFAELLAFGNPGTYTEENHRPIDADGYMLGNMSVLGVFDYVRPFAGDDYDDRLQHRLSTIPSKEYSILANQVLRDTDFSESLLKEREILGQELSSWYNVY